MIARHTPTEKIAHTTPSKIPPHTSPRRQHCTARQIYPTKICATPISILITNTLGTFTPASDHISDCISGITVNGSTCSPSRELNSTPQITANTPPKANTAERRFMPLSRARFLYHKSPPPIIMASP